MTAAIELTDHERRVLAYLDQRGGSAHRANVVADLAQRDTTARYQRAIGPQAAALIMGSWCKRLGRAGYVQVRHVPSRLSTRGGGTKTLHFYDRHEITRAGTEALRGG